MLRGRAITTGFFLLFALWQAAEAQHLSWRHYTSDHGLPGNEVFDMLQDSRGYLWFVTNQGICRFNGYEFSQPVDTSALRGSEIFLPTEDAKGKIWFTRLDGSVWFVDNDTIRAWPYNAVTAPYREKFTLVEKMGITQTGEVWLALANLGFLVVETDGAHRVVSDSAPNFFLFTEIAGRLIFTSRHRYISNDKKETVRPRYMDVVQWKKEKPIPLGPLLINWPLQRVERGIWKLNNGDFVFYRQGSISLIHNNKIVWQAPTDILPEEIRQTPGGSIFIASHGGKNSGLFYFASLEHLRRAEYRNLLPGRFVSDFYADPDGGWWATTTHAGIFYCKNPGIDIFDKASGLPSDEVACITNDGATTVFAGLRPVGIAALHRQSGTQIAVIQPPIVSRMVQAIFFDTLQQRLWCSEPLHYFDHNKWTAATSFDAEGRKLEGVLAKKITPDPFGEYLWSSATHGFFKINARTAQSTQLGEASPNLAPARTFSVTPDHEGNLWVTTPRGLRLWHDGAYTLPPFDHPALRFQARDVVVLPDSSVVVGLQGAGLLIRDKKGNLTHLTQSKGLSSDYMTKLYASADGGLFACSPAGLTRLAPNPAGGWDIKIISMREGLPSNQVNDVMTLAGDTWVATNRGLARFRHLPVPAPMPAPVLEQLRINSIPVAFAPGLRLPHHQNDLSIRFFALHYRSEGDIQYRYRLNGTDTPFAYSRTREVNFANLSPGDYTFEVQAQNETGAWSAATRWSFCIRAAWWQTMWFWATLFVILAGGLVLWYRSRLRLVRREAETNSKIRNLESAALRAQMNPHFIFNCLSSIQHFITENDADAATRYLARFARLVRLALHGSVDGRHSLREEVEMLDNYLALEQLRFRGRFVYTIETAPDLDIDDVSLPPMLVQPFLENALLHGMSNKTEGGRIGVAFALQGHSLLVTMTDNGPGFGGTTANQPTDSGRKSVGMMLTQRRLDILAELPGEAALQHENILDTAGHVAGMKVVLRIPVEA